jgi:hypothetical protein
MREGRPVGAVDRCKRKSRETPETLIRKWLVLRRRRDGLKLDALAEEFRVSRQRAQQIVTGLVATTEAWRCKHGICGHCGRVEEGTT